MTNRIHNFCAGPCTLPLSVLQKAQEELLDFNGYGMSVMEISHRSKMFEPLHYETLDLAAELISLPDNFQTLLLPGGASMQFVMTAAHLLAEGGEAALVDSGHWAQRAGIEANRIGKMTTVWSGKETNYQTLPKSEEIILDKDYKYLHLTSNETIGGIEFRELPTVKTPLVVDASSNFYCNEIPWDKCLIVYGGTQKNLAPSGLGLVFVRKDLLVEHPNISKFLTYKIHADNSSLYNTPPTFQIYILNMVLKWMKEKGGIAYFHEFSKQKSQKLYDFIDSSDFYKNEIKPEFRSTTNVVFKTPSEELDTAFWQGAEKAGLSGLKGHRVVGGIRASLYNALEMNAVEDLISYMKQFEKERS